MLVWYSRVEVIFQNFAQIEDEPEEEEDEELEEDEEEVLEDEDGGDEEDAGADDETPSDEDAVSTAPVTWSKVTSRWFWRHT